jgi:hypothetical protein
MVPIRKYKVVKFAKVVPNLDTISFGKKPTKEIRRTPK